MTSLLLLWCLGTGPGMFRHCRGAWGQAPTCFVIAESLRQFYYRELCEWRQGRPTRLLETSRTGQDVFALALRTFGYAALADKAEVEIGSRHS